jgi:hypothetical protein
MRFTHQKVAREMRPTAAPAESRRQQSSPRLSTAGDGFFREKYVNVGAIP